MGYFSDIDIKKALNKDIVIEPFAPECLTPIGYDFRIGEYVFSLEHGLLETINGLYELPPKSTIQVLTKEALWVSKRIAGTFHSKVSLVARGLSHISTTLDPQWHGPLLITLRNNTDKIIKVNPGDTFVTLLFARVRTPTKSPHNKPSHRKDILIKQLEEQTQDYIKKIADVLTDTTAKTSFAKKVDEANRPMSAKIVASIRAMNREEHLRFAAKVGLFLLIGLLSSLQQIWGFIAPFFHSIAYDSKVFVGQMTAIIAALALLVNISKK